VLGWVLDEVGKQALGQDYGAAVTFAPSPVQTPAGIQVIPAWFLLVTARNPILREGPLYHGPVPMSPGAPRPVEAEVRAAVADGLRQLRDLAASKLAGGNGRGPVLAKGAG
jgi:hypothetical protein